MRAARFGQLIAGQLANPTTRETLAAQWCATHAYEMPSSEWTEQSEEHFEAQFLIADIFHARNTQHREVRLERYI